jgi:hypothetical protein
MLVSREIPKAPTTIDFGQIETEMLGVQYQTKDKRFKLPLSASGL